VCDTLEPWEHGTVVRSSLVPDYWFFNLVRVEEDADLDVAGLEAVANEALAGLAHRCIDFEPVDVGDRVRADLDRRGWKTTRLLWLRHEGPRPGGPDIAVQEVGFDAVRDLRAAWLREDFPEMDPTAFLAQASHLARRIEVRVFAVLREGAPIAFTQIEHAGDVAEITDVYVAPRHRGAGIGTALTCAAIEAADPPGDLWIVADDEARAKELYVRLGFRPVRRMMGAVLLP
jgi:ribosomal protein S18 acetylase RimI-like enzyme